MEGESSMAGGRKQERNPYKRTVLSGFAGTKPYTRLETTGEMGALAVRTLRLAVTPPFNWWGEAIRQISLGFRRGAIPLFVSHSAYVIGFGIILFGGIVGNLGLIDREAGILSIIWSREIATWITGMIFAGIVGSAITADLGSRKIREELDALAVLGVEQTRNLVVPRVIACTIAMPALVLLSLLAINLVNFAIAPTLYDVSAKVYLDGLINLIAPTDIYFTTTLKNVILGFFVGVVACYKGVSCGSGAEGVGRAVNQTVVVTFFGIWLFNTLFNYAYATLFPEAFSFRG